jgi:hypothetical protein
MRLFLPDSKIRRDLLPHRGNRLHLTDNDVAISRIERNFEPLSVNGKESDRPPTDRVAGREGPVRGGGGGNRTVVILLIQRKIA